MAFNIFGVEIDSHTIKIAVVEKSFRSHQLVRLVSEDIRGAGETSLSKTLARMTERLGFDKDEDQVAVVFPADRMSSRRIETPLTRRGQIAETIDYEIESKISFGVDEFVSDFITIATTEHGSRLLAFIALKTDVEKQLKIYFDAGVDPDYFIPAPLAALANQRGRMRDDETFMLLDIGLRSTVITIARGANPVFFHTVYDGLEMVSEDSGVGINEVARALDGEDITNDGLRKSIDRFTASLSTEITRSRISAGLDDPSTKIKIVTLGSASICARLLNAPDSDHATSIERLEPPVGDTLVESDPKTVYKPPVLSFTNAIGSALRVADHAKFEQVNLRKDRFEKKGKFTQDRTQAVIAILFLAVAFSLALGAYITQGVHLNERYSAIKSDIRKKFTAALPQVKRIVSESPQLKNALAELKEKSKALGPALKEKDPFLDRLLDISKSAPEDMSMDVDELTYEWGAMAISGETGSFENVERLKRSIGKMSWVTKVVVERAKTAPSGQNVDFRLELTTDE